MEDQTDGVPPPATDEADTMAHRHFPKATAPGGCRSLIDGEHERVALAQREDIGSLSARGGLGHDEFTTLEIVAGLGEQDRHLQREDMLAIEVLVQAVEVAFPVFEDERGRSCLTCLMAASKKIVQFARVAHADAQSLIPAIRDRHQAPIHRMP